MMSMGQSACLFTIVACGVATRLPFLLGRSSDRATHLWLMRLYHRTRVLRRPYIADGVMQGQVMYPPLPGFLIAQLSQGMWAPASAVINFMADIAVAVALYFLLLTLTGRTEGFALLGALLWLTLPILHPINARLLALGARGIGPALVVLFFLAVQQAESAASPWPWWLLGVGTGVFLLLSSQFATQALVVFVFISSAVSLDATPFLMLACALAFGLAVPALGLAGQLRAKWNHYLWYWQEGHRFIGVRNSPAQWLKLLNSPRGLMKSTLYLYESVSPSVVFFGLIGPLLIVLLHDPEFSLPRPGLVAIPAMAVLLGLSSLAPFLLTMRGPLVIFGEAERYVEYASPWVVLALLIGAKRDMPMSWLGAGVAVNLLFVAVNLALILTRSDFGRHAGWRKAAVEDVMRRLAVIGPRRIATSPLSLASELAMQDAGSHKYLHLLVGDEKGRLVHWPRGEAVYPLMAMDERALQDNWTIDTIVLDKGWRTRMTGVMDPACLGAFDLLYEGEVFEIFVRGPVRDR